MNSDNLNDSTRPDTLVADAVCAQCSTVNAEGTLLCKVCGNNLRDQRMIRLTADQAMDLELSGSRRRSWLSGILFLLAIALIISTLVYQDAIVEWLINPGGSSNAVGRTLWAGANDAIFSDLSSTLAARAVTEEDALAAQEAPAPSGATLDGTYALFKDDEFAGAAIVAAQADQIYFLAVLESGDEVRGLASAQGSYYASLPASAAVRNRRGIGEVRGVAMPQSGGVLECIGDYGNDQFDFVAYLIPET